MHPTGRTIAVALALAGAALAKPAAATDGNYNLVGYLLVTPLVNYTDIWGWRHPGTGRAYALVGNNADGLHVVDATDPTNPYQVSVIPNVPRFDMKTWKHWVYSVDGLTGPGGITDLTDPAHPVVVGTFPGGHNICIDAQGYLYVCLPGLKVYELNTDPTVPKYVWGVNSSDGHDAVVVGDILYEFRGFTGTIIWDISDRRYPQVMGTITDPAITFHHQGWPTGDGHYLFIADEQAFDPNPDITVWNIEDPAHAVKVAGIYDPTSTAHNCYVVGNYLLVAYYTAGFKVYDISDPTQPTLADSYDTSALSGEGDYEGAWGCYPFAPGGVVYINDRPNGLFIFAPDFATGTGRAPAAGPALDPGFPNPFGSSTTLSYRLRRAADVSLTVHDAAGRRIRALHVGADGAGTHTLVWDGNDDAGRSVASGVYFVRLRAGALDRVRKVVRLR
jgi:choice-of-anchor B domain-containing protein